MAENICKVYNIVYGKMLDLNSDNFDATFYVLRDSIICNRLSTGLNNMSTKPVVMTKDTSGIECFYPYTFGFDVDDCYKGNMLHHIVNDNHIAPENLKYVIAFLRFSGCDFYDQKDSNSYSACLLVTKKVSGYTIFREVSLLLEILEKRV